MSIKELAINGVLWNSASKFGSVGIEFIVAILLARLLSPAEFGLISTITVLILLSEVFVDSGLSQAIIRKQNCSQKDYSTVFFCNISVGVLFFLILLLTAAPISGFFKNPELKPLIQVLGVSLIISSLSLVQNAKLIKRIDFKLQTKISLTASSISGIIAIILALLGFGVWSLVVKVLTNKSLKSILLWYFNKWKPDFVFSRESFKELFGFGSKLLLSGLIGTFLQNINYILIAKYFSAQDLGYYHQAEMFKNIPSQNISGVVTSVGYPVLAKQQHDSVKMRKIFRQMFTKTCFIIIILMVGLASIAKSLIITLLGTQWAPSIILLQMLCFVGLMYPLNSMNVNILNVVGRSDLYFKLQMIVQVMALPNLLIGVFFGIKALIIGMIIISIFGYIIFNYESNKVLNYSIIQQLKDISPSILMATIMGALIFSIELISNFNSLSVLIMQLLSGILFVMICGELFKMNEYVFIKKIILSLINSNKDLKKI
jgi:O-antigen/teichoic acid export membrane protein